MSSAHLIEFAHDQQVRPVYRRHVTIVYPKAMADGRPTSTNHSIPLRIIDDSTTEIQIKAETGEPY